MPRREKPVADESPRAKVQSCLEVVERYLDPDNHAHYGPGGHGECIRQLAAAMAFVQAQVDEMNTLMIDPRPRTVKLRPGETLVLETKWGPVEASVSRDATLTLYKDPKDQKLAYELRGFFVPKEGPQ